MPKPDYDTTLARIAGNIAAGLVNHPYYQLHDRETLKHLGVNEGRLASHSVLFARMIVGEIKRTAPSTPPPQDQE